MIDIQTIINYIAIISVPVGVAYHILTLNNTRKNQQMQLETRQAQMFMQIYNQINSPYFQEAVRKLIPLNFDNFEEFNEIFNFETIEGQENWMPMLTVVSYYEGVGALVKEGLLDIKFVALLICGQTINLWEKFAPFADEIREYVKNKRWASEWEFLYNELIKYLDEHPELKP